jgi:hypothetical protein
MKIVTPYDKIPRSAVARFFICKYVLCQNTNDLIYIHCSPLRESGFILIPGSPPKFRLRAFSEMDDQPDGESLSDSDRYHGIRFYDNDYCRIVQDERYFQSLQSSDSHGEQIKEKYLSL